MKKNNLKIWVYGAGAIGCYYGARLAQAGHSISFVARGEQLIALKQNGLNIKSCDGDLSFNSVDAFGEEELKDASKPDLVIIAAKRTSNEEIGLKLKTLIAPETPCFVFQNGLRSHEIFKNILNPTQVFRVVANIAVRLNSPGQIAHSSGGNIFIQSGHPLGEQLHESFLQSKVKSKLSGNIQKDIWGKMMWNAPFNSVTALTRLTTTPILSDTDGLNLIKSIGNEVYTLASANDIQLPIDLIQNKIDFTLNELGDISTSTLEDVLQKKSIEYQAIVGDLVDEAKRLKVETPYIQTVFTLLKLLDKSY